MTGTLRSTARSPVAIALMGLLVLVFLVLGVGGGRFPDVFKNGQANAVVSAGGHSLNPITYRRIFEQQRQAFNQQNKQEFTSEFLIQNGFDQQLLNELALDQSFSEFLAKVGIDPAPSLVDAQIRQIPFAFDKVTGKFSETQFNQFLASQGMTARDVQSDLADELAARHFTFAMGAGFKAPRAFAALTAIPALQSRDVSYFLLDQRAVVPPKPPTDADLTALMQAHASQLTRPETRVVTLARFSAAALLPATTVAEDAIRKEFDARKDSLSSPETRVIVQIPVKTAAEGAQAAQRLGRGEDPAVIARAFGAEPVIYQNKPKTGVPDGKIADAAFAMKAGAVAGPVQGDLGLAAIKVGAVTPARTATLESARPKILEDLRLRAAQNKAYELSQKFDDARQAGANLADAAQKSGVAAVTVGPFTADGGGPDGRPNPLITDKIAKTAFTLRAGETSEIQDATSGEYYALRVEKVLPPALPAVDEIRPQLTQAYMRQQLLAALNAKAESLVAQIKRGDAIPGVAASVGSHVVARPGLQLIQARSYADLSREFLTAVFSGKAGDVFAAPANDGLYVAKLDAVRPADVATMARFVEAVRQRVSQDYGRDLLNDVKVAAEQTVKVEINTGLARQAMGVDPAAGAKTGAKKGAAK